MFTNSMRPGVGRPGHDGSPVGGAMAYVLEDRPAGGTHRWISVKAALRGLRLDCHPDGPSEPAVATINDDGGGRCVMQNELRVRLDAMPTLVKDPPPAEFKALLERRCSLGQDRFDEVWEGVL